jgi:hypothetical protein
MGGGPGIERMSLLMSAARNRPHTVLDSLTPASNPTTMPLLFARHRTRPASAEPVAPTAIPLPSPRLEPEYDSASVRKPSNPNTILLLPKASNPNTIPLPSAAIEPEYNAASVR